MNPHPLLVSARRQRLNTLSKFSSSNNNDGNFEAEIHPSPHNPTRISFDVVIRVVVVAPSLECAIFFRFLVQFLLFFVITRAPIDLFRIYVNYPTDGGAADADAA